MAAVSLTALAAVAAGCSKSEPEDTPAACLGGPDAYLEALQTAPGVVRLADDTPISDCLAEDQEAGDLAEVGSAMIAAATELNREALEPPEGPATVRLGYLVGAAERAAEETAGIHSDLILRLNSAARFSPSGEASPEFDEAFARGLEAGEETG
jgi:hypothetical protein